MATEPSNVHILFPSKEGETRRFIDQKRARRIPGSFVYFMQAGARRIVKIGTSRNPAKRAADLQTGTPDEYRILAVMPGGKAEEIELHERFAEHRVSGEWFKRTPEMTALINELEREYGWLKFDAWGLDRARLVEERKHAAAWKKGAR